MHMSDALLTLPVGAAFWALSGGAIIYSSRKVQQELDHETSGQTIPLMGVMGAFIFAVQMINFAIPGTGSSGHLGGGLLVAILLGSHAGFLVMASVLTVQALFFADGGLLALGSNLFNLALIPCFLVYPFLKWYWSHFKGSQFGRTAGIVFASLWALLLGATSLVLQTTLSGITALPFREFALLMIPLHIAVGLVEGVVTAAVIRFIGQHYPNLGFPQSGMEPNNVGPIQRLIVGVGIVALVIGGGISWVASQNPDGLEWSIERLTGTTNLQSDPKSVSSKLKQLQDQSALFPEYGFRLAEGSEGVEEGKEKPIGRRLVQPEVESGIAGVVGGAFSLAAIVLLGVVLRYRVSKT